MNFDNNFNNYKKNVLAYKKDYPFFYYTICTITVIMFIPVVIYLFLLSFLIGNKGSFLDRLKEHYSGNNVTVFDKVTADINLILMLPFLSWTYLFNLLYGVKVENL